MAQPTSFVLFFASAFAWNLGLGMSYIVIPLYADHLGYPGVAVGSLIALPVTLQITLNLLGGAWTDRVGGKQLALWAAATTLLAAIVFAVSSSLATLFAGQLLLTVSRAVFWPATWTLGSHLAGDRGAQMGRLNSVTSAGQIVGTVLAGLVIAYAGFRAAFWCLAVLGGALSLVFMAFFTAPVHVKPRVPVSIFAGYAALARRPSLWFGLMCAYVAALPSTLSLSFYPILLVNQGFSTDATGWLVALRAVGSVFAGVTAAQFVRRVTSPAIPFAFALGMGISVLLIALFSSPLPIGVLLFLVGFASGVMTLYFQLLIADLSSMATRGSALALGGVGWALSHFTTPMYMGALKDALGIDWSFYATGVVTIALAFALVPMHAWAFRGGGPR